MSPVLDLIAVLDLVADCRRELVTLRCPTRRTNPVKPHEVYQHRSLACPEYDRCLDIAYRREWPSWTCQRCPHYALAATFRSLEATARVRVASVG
jgi:hypothetical protein